MVPNPVLFPSEAWPGLFCLSFSITVFQAYTRIVHVSLLPALTAFLVQHTKRLHLSLTVPNLIGLMVRFVIAASLHAFYLFLSQFCFWCCDKVNWLNIRAVCFSSQFQVTVHHSREVEGAGTSDRHITLAQEQREMIACMSEAQVFYTLLQGPNQGSCCPFSR